MTADYTAERRALMDAADNVRKGQADKIIAEVAAQVAGVDDQRDRLAMQVGMLQAEIRKLCPPVPNPAYMGRCAHHVNAEIEGLGDCCIHYDYSPGRPGCNYMPNGDPGYPDEPAELYVTAVQIGNCEFDYEVFSADVQEHLDEACRTDVVQRDEAAMADRDEREFDYSYSEDV